MAVFVGLVAVGAVALARRRDGPWSASRWTLRGGLLVACVAAGTGPMWRDAGAARTRVLVLDRSRSLGAAAAAVDRAAASALSDLGGRERVAIVVFGQRAQVVLPPTILSEARERLAEALAAAPPDWGSDLPSALRQAAALLPPGVGEVVVITDGRVDAGGDLEGALAEVAARGAPIYAWAPDSATPASARLAALEAPASAAIGERVFLRATVSAARSTHCTLHFERRVGRRWVSLAQREGRAGPGQDYVVGFDVPAALGRREGALTLRARVEALGRDEGPEDDALEARVAVGRAPRALVVGRPLPALAGRDLAVETLRPSEVAAALRHSLPELVVLSDAAASSLEPAVPALRAALQAGVALIVCGTGAFGPGGYGGSALEGLLPVTSGPSEERQRSLALLVVLDASGSMASGRYLKAVQAGIPWKELQERDRLAVLLFSDEPRLVLPFSPLPDDLRERLLAAQPSGGTDVGRALSRGLELLNRSSADERLLILATDSEEATPQRHAAQLRALAAKLEGRSARAVLIHIGEGPSTSLETLALAMRGGGLDVAVARAADANRSLRDLLEGELSAGRTEVRRGRFALGSTSVAAELGLKPPRSVAAYVPVRARQDPTVRALGQVQDAELEAPPWGVLGRVGLGRVLCLPLRADACVPLVRSACGTLIRARRDDVRLAVRRVRGGVSARVDAQRDLPLDLVLHLGEDRHPLQSVTPRWARVRVDASLAPAGPLHAAVVAGQDRLAVASLPGNAHEELAHTGPDHALLRRLAEATGGRVLTGPPSSLPRSSAGRRPLAPWLAGLALALLVLDLASLALRLRRSPREARA
jgi:Mg-chelatase subunit ChlD